MSCREICRRTFRGCLRIPGCKTICYKCILPPCCSGDSDDEKDDKDDEGYDSYGITASHNPEPQQLVTLGTRSAREEDVENHDYVNEPLPEQMISSEIDNKLAEVMYVSMNKPENEDHNTASKATVQYTVIRDTSNNNQHDYVNESVLFAKSGSDHLSNHTDAHMNGELQTNVTDTCIDGCSSPTQRQKSSKVTDSSIIREYETRSLENKITDSVSNQHTLILLETDL